MSELGPGTLLHGYRVERLLGAGGMGSVHLAVHEPTGRTVALKSMNPAAAASEEFRKRFRREARAAMAVVHPNVVKTHEIFENDGIPYIAMEFLQGESLEQRLTRVGAVPVGELARMMVRVTSAVGTAHAMGIVHRDLKPDNVFLVEAGGESDVKVLDFGIAKLTATDGAAAETAALTKTGTLMGTPFYMSPEQAFGDKTIDQRADVWSIGIIMYRALSGILPTRAAGFGEVFRLVVKEAFKPLREVAPGVPVDLAELVDRMLQKSRDARPWDLRETYAVLVRHAETAAEQAAPSFGIAVAPIWDEPSGAALASTPGGSPAEPLAVTPGGSKPLALSPGALRMAPAPLTAGPRAPSMPGGDTVALPTPNPIVPTLASAKDEGAATLVYERPAVDVVNASPESIPSLPVSRFPIGWVALVAVVAGGAVAAWFLR